MKRFLLALLLMVALLAQAPQAYAHVLITDDTKTQGVILHINPDDDPVAGENATIYFELQKDLSDSITLVQLTVENSSGKKSAVPISVEGSLATADYTFPAQGSYKLALIVQTRSSIYAFHQTQRISRGVTASALDTPRYSWAEMLLLACGIGFACLVILFINNHKDIKRQSRF